jgi:general secretion pathway protein N
MKLRWIAISLLVGYAFFLLATVPAWMVARNLAQWSGGAAIASDPEGSLWRGAARIELPRQGLALKRVDWRFQPLGLLSGELRFAVRVVDPVLTADAVIGHGFTRMIVRDAKGTLSASTAAALAPALAVFAPGGTLDLAVADLRCAGADCDGSATAQWRNASLSLSEQRPLGDYAATATLRAGRAEFEVKTLSGGLRVAGRGTWQAPQRVGFNGEASAAPDVMPRVQGLLKLLGNPDERGTVKFNVTPR